MPYFKSSPKQKISNNKLENGKINRAGQYFLQFYTTPPLHRLPLSPFLEKFQ